MSKNDILIKKDSEIKDLNEKILKLQEKINSLNVVLGSKDELLKWKDVEIQRIKDDKSNEEKVVIKEASKTCDNCGYNSPYSICPSCGRKKDYKVIEVKNLDEAITEINKKATNELKKTIAELEDIQLDLEIKIEKLENTIKRERKAFSNEKEEIESNTRKRYNKIIKGYDEEIEELKELLNKTKKRNTEEDQKLLTDLKIKILEEENVKLLHLLKEEKKLNFWNKLWYKLVGAETIARKEFEKEKMSASWTLDRINHLVSNRFAKNRYGVSYQY